MPTTFASLGLDHLSAQEKWAVAHDLMDEAEHQDRPPGCGLGPFPGGFATREEFHAEITRRIAHADAHPELSHSFEEIDAEMEAELNAADRVRE